MGETVLLTGATGFLGRHTVRALEESGWEVIRCVRAGVPHPARAQSVECDLNDPAGLLALEPRYHPKAIVHLACHVGWDGSNDERLFVPNVLATGCFAHLARVWGAKLIFASAAIVHGSRCERINSDSPVQPDSPYGRSKALGEALIQASGVEYSILRIAGMFGCDGPGHLGLNRAIDDALHGVPPTQIGEGSGLRNYVYVRDVANAIVVALRANAGGTYLVSGSEVLSIRSMLEAVCETFLPGMRPVIKPGTEAADQVVSASPMLPATRNFREALLDIHRSKQTCD